MNKLVNGVLIALTEEENEAARATQTNESERWALNRQREYPTIQECIHAILA